MAPGIENESIKPNQEVIESTLSELGLNRYEARVYLSLISEGVTTAKTISSITSIPYGKVYEVIDSLARKGFVQVLPTKPAKYTTISPKESLDRIKKTTQDKLSKVESLLIEQLEPLFNKHKKFVEPQNSFWILNGRSAVNQKTQELIGNAQKKICILTTAAGLDRLQLMAPQLKAAKSKGVKVSVIAPLSADKTHTHLNGCTCKHIEKAPSTIIVADDKNALFIEPVPDDTSLHYGRDLGVWIANKNFAKCLEQLYQLGLHQN